ncbi:magnesium and cobalt transport protein CorA [Dactylosporangium aurantiacum]|uniref:Magnesium and cobalt transport protein CorA n=1 Tax=Dactylosporangium aurantiacum TaxID=35754 RepID=A0A9Q9MD27_9ACTN|nr:magnesium and cobalt transport protein CorA [Dactylosporangium aurantiacum]MDG6110166.1 magnesium and cobalt transport protein CorA [Dactylosporangium aurantiacum]UWZ54638.1 magnesium and cobalt transport protein CorA [Dactylosporangium aurantiacum]
MTEEQLAGPFSRALARPVRAMSRMLSPATPNATTVEPVAAGSSIVDCALYVDGVRQPGEWHYAAALTAARKHRHAFVWVGLKEPGAREMAAIAETFQLHELAVEDAVTSSQRPKVERYNDMTFMTMRTARYVEHDELTENSEVVETGDVLMFIGEHFIITVRHGDACRLTPVRADLERRREVLAGGPWAVAYAVADTIVDVMVEVVAAIEEDVAIIEDQVFSPARGGKGKDTDRIQRVYQLKRELMEFKRAVLPLQRPLGGLVSGQLAEVPEEIRRYFRDVNDHLVRTVEQVLYLDDVINSVLQARLAQVSVDQNNDMRKIAAWAGIAAVWTSVAGVYGMNFDFMPETKWVFGYPGVMTLMVVASALLYRAFRRSGWL